MSAATKRLVGGEPHGFVGRDWALRAPVVATTPERHGDPEWQSLRLFGRGRHPGAFEAGAETRDKL